MDSDCLRNGLSLDSEDGIRACAVYAQAVCKWLEQSAQAYDVVHCDGLETALIPVMMRRVFAGSRMNAVKSVVFVNGIENKGSIDMMWIARMGLPGDLASSENMEFYGKLSILKGAYLYADAVAFPNDTIRASIENNIGRDIGMEGVLFNKLDRIHTIRIGSSFKNCSPSSDRAIEANYTSADLAGKTRCKTAFAQMMHLKKDRPVVAFIGQLNADSGIELVNDILDDLMDRQVSLVIAGQGSDAYNAAVDGWKNEFKGSIAWMNTTPSCDDVRRILSAADIILIPAKHDNICRLHQIAMHYGCIPVARNLGAAANDIHSVRDIDHVGTEDNGFSFDKYDSDEFFNATMDALDVYASSAWKDLCSHAMDKSFCICQTASDCVRIYQSLKD